MMTNKRLNKFGEMLGEYLEEVNMNLNEFAYRIETTPKNLIDIINGKVRLSDKMIRNIAYVTGISESFIYNTEVSFEMDSDIDNYIKKNNITVKEYLKKFNYKELKENNIIDFRNEKSDYTILEDIFHYLRINSPSLIYKNDNYILYKSKNDKIELLAIWLEMCYRETFNQQVKEYSKDNIQNVVDFIKDQAKNNKFNEELLVKTFNENGIYLCIVDDLKGSKIRGAFRVLRDKPAIYITRKHKRYADIYFALLHELAHCASNFNRAKKASIVSLIDDKDLEDYEIRADKTALNWMVDNALYALMLEDLEHESVEHIINSYDCIKSFVVYRLALDKKISYSSKEYQNNNLLIND